MQGREIKLIKIYTGRAEDLRHIAEHWQGEHNDFGFEMSMDEHLADLQDMIDSEGKDLLVLGEPSIGYMGLTTFKNPLGTELFANEHYWYIVPEKRRGAGALKLIRAAQKWAIQKGCDYLLMTASKLASDLHDNVCRLYSITGFSHFETTYIKRIR